MLLHAREADLTFISYFSIYSKVILQHFTHHRLIFDRQESFFESLIIKEAE